MAQTGFTPIQLYSTSTAAAAPVAGNLTNSTLGSELAINITDGKLFYKDNANAVQVIGWKTVPTTAGGTGLTTYTAGDLSYYASGTTFTKLAIGTTGQILTSTGSAPQWSTLSGVAVTTFSAGTTGFTPNSATSGAVTLAGTLAVGNGGTGTSTAFTAGSIIFAGASGVYSQDNTNLFWDDTNNRLGIGTATPQGKFQVLNSGSLSSDTDSNTGTIIAGANQNATSSQANLFIYSNSTATDGFGGSIAFGGFYTGTSVAAFGRIAGVRNGGSYWGDLTFSTRNPSGSMVEAMRISSAQGVNIGGTSDPGAGNLSLTGNVVIGTSGKGIDFSATAGTGTSELLNDYEEGTFTPTYVPQTNSFTAITYDAETGGKYVKIGNVVHIQAILVTDAITVGTATGGIRIGGLPFTISANTGSTANGWSSLAIGAAIDWAGERPSSCITRQNTSLLTLNYRTAADGNTLTSVVADLGTGANSNILYVAGTYVTA
jgi:hypothetical protein